MIIEGVYYSELDWAKVGFLWAYRFYRDGVLLFTHASRVGHLILQTERGSVTCTPNDVLETRTRLPDFIRSFSRDAAEKLTYRSGRPAVTQGAYTTEGTNISMSHPYFQFPAYLLTGQILGDHLMLSPFGGATTIGERKTLANRDQRFSRLQQ